MCGKDGPSASRSGAFPRKRKTCAVSRPRTARLRCAGGASARIAPVGDGSDLPRIVPHFGLGGVLLEGLPDDSVRLPI